jgi:hypothetical protein
MLSGIHIDEYKRHAIYVVNNHSQVKTVVDTIMLLDKDRIESVTNGIIQYKAGDKIIVVNASYFRYNPKLTCDALYIDEVSDPAYIIEKCNDPKWAVIVTNME